MFWGIRIRCHSHECPLCKTVWQCNNETHDYINNAVEDKSMGARMMCVQCHDRQNAAISYSKEWWDKYCGFVK